jgi:hypothetical protein
MAVGITRTANPAGVTSSANVITYSGASIGTASQDRVIVVVLGEETAQSITGANIDGVAMTQIATSSFNTVSAFAWFLPWPTGTTATITITTNASVLGAENHIGVYAITDAKFPVKQSGSDTSTDMDASDPLTTGSVTIPTGGGFLAVVSGATDTASKTWVNATVDIEEDAGLFRFTTATTTTPGTVTITCTGSTNNEDGCLVYLILEPQALPFVGMPPMRPAHRDIRQ